MILLGLNYLALRKPIRWGYTSFFYFNFAAFVFNDIAFFGPNQGVKVGELEGNLS